MNVIAAKNRRRFLHLSKAMGEPGDNLTVMVQIGDIASLDVVRAGTRLVTQQGQVYVVKQTPDEIADAIRHDPDAD